MQLARSMTRGWVLAALMGGVAATPAWGVDVHTTHADDVINVAGMGEHNIDGVFMADAGMTVTAHFQNGPSETVVLTQLLGSGVAMGNAWTLSTTGDTFQSEWTLEFLGDDVTGPLVGFTIDGFAGGGNIGIVFDRIHQLQHGTVGSHHGWDYETLSDVPFHTHVQYRNPISVNGADPVGDLYGTLDVSFFVIFDEESGAAVGGLDGTNVTRLVFRVDTDSVIVPEPASVMLVGAGAALLLRRRRD